MTSKKFILLNIEESVSIHSWTKLNLNIIFLCICLNRVWLRDWREEACAIFRTGNFRGMLRKILKTKSVILTLLPWFSFRKSVSVSNGMYIQGSKLTLVRWPVASGFAVGPVKSAIHWPGWPVKFWKPTSEITWFSANLSYRMNQCQHLNWIYWY